MILKSWELQRPRMTEVRTTLNSTESYRVAVVEWISEQDGLAQVIGDELAHLGHRPLLFKQDSAVPAGADVVFTFAPYGKLLPILRRLASLPVEERPTVVHWNTEGIPDLRMPWSLMTALSAGRSWIGRLPNANHRLVGVLGAKLTASWETRVLRFRYVGDYYYAYRRGWLNVFADSSVIYAQLHRQHGLPTVVAPWGATLRWYADLGLKRDIDVLWMGQRGSRRRGKLLDRIRQELGSHGVEMRVADNQESPFIFGQERTEFLNRAKITLNLARTWYDDNYSRFAMAAPNRSLIVSEPLLPHCPQYEAGTHYVSAPADRIAEAIVYYLKNEDERLRIVENAYQLVTTALTFRNSIKTIMDAVSKTRQAACTGNGEPQ
jgi:hypothetical protein